MRPKEQIAADTQTIWAIDPGHTTVEFAVRNFWITTVKGSLEVSEGPIVRDPDLIRSSVSILMNSASINTRNKQRDAHLRAAVYLDSDRYPDIRFESTKVERGTDRDTLRITGALTIKGASKEIVLDVNEIDRSCSPSGEHVEYYTATTAIDRRDFKIDAMPLVIGRKLDITINLQAIRHT